jgi:hypothetical protein
MNHNPQTNAPTDYLEAAQALQTTGAAERRLHRIRRAILRKMEARISLENWSNLLRCPHKFRVLSPAPTSSCSIQDIA